MPPLAAITTRHFRDWPSSPTCFRIHACACTHIVWRSRSAVDKDRRASHGCRDRNESCGLLWTRSAHQRPKYISPSPRHQVHTIALFRPRLCCSFVSLWQFLVAVCRTRNGLKSAVACARGRPIGTCSAARSRQFGQQRGHWSDRRSDSAMVDACVRRYFRRSLYPSLCGSGRNTVNSFALHIQLYDPFPLQPHSAVQKVKDAQCASGTNSDRQRANALPPQRFKTCATPQDIAKFPTTVLWIDPTLLTSASAFGFQL